MNKGRYSKKVGQVVRLNSSKGSVALKVEDGGKVYFLPIGAVLGVGSHTKISAGDSLKVVFFENRAVSAKLG